MTAKINSSEVLSYLNKYGIHTIDEDAFKQFMKDLKKLVKYEQRKKEAPASGSPLDKKNAATTDHPSEVGCNCDIRISSCCPENSATVTYVHCPRKVHEEIENECNRVETSKTNELPLKNPGRSTSSLSHVGNQHKKKKRKMNDPVELYHYYQSFWKNHKLPGENGHYELRREIRNRLMMK